MLSSGTDRHLGITFILAYSVVESSSLVSVLFREAFSHPNISFFHLLVNVFCVTSFRTYFADPYLPYIRVSASTPSANEPAKDLILVHTGRIKPR